MLLDLAFPGLAAALGGERLATFLGVAEAFRAAGVLPILHMKVEEALFVHE